MRAKKILLSFPMAERRAKAFSSHKSPTVKRLEKTLPAAHFLRHDDACTCPNPVGVFGAT